MNDVLVTRVHWLLMLAFLTGGLPSFPIKCKISSRKVGKKLYALGILKTNSLTLTSWSETSRIRLQITPWTSMYFFVMQGILIIGLLVGTFFDPYHAQQKNARNVTWIGTMYSAMCLYSVAIISTTILMSKRMKMQQFLDSWLLLSSIGLDFAKEKNSNPRLCHDIDVMNQKISHWSSSKSFIKNLGLFGYGAFVLSIIIIGLLSEKKLPLLLIIQLATQLRSDVGAILYLLVAASECDRIMSFNGALREILPTATKQTTKDLKYFCQMTRNEEKKAQDVLNAATAFCHLQRILGSVFTMTNVLYYARNNNVGLETIISSLPDFIYYMVALCIFYCLGNRYAVQMNLTKEVIQSTECTNEDAENEASLGQKLENMYQYFIIISKFRDIVSENIYYSAGNVVRFTLGGLWQDGQYLFTVVAVILQLYESDAPTLRK